MKIILIRHGEAASSWEESADPGLSDLGKAQAEACSNELLKLKNIRTYSLISSPLTRAKETSEPLSKEINVPVSINPLFAEIPSPGINLSERKEWLQKIFKMKLSDLETPQKKWKDAIITELENLDKPTIIFSHFMVINIIVSYLKKSDLIVNFYPDNCSITNLSRDSKGRIELLNLGSELQTELN
tara:strand:- start:104 stop:661 length:558 start_codon:yes stop_codon:yes gene_type:complete